MTPSSRFPSNFSIFLCCSAIFQLAIASSWIKYDVRPGKNYTNPISPPGADDTFGSLIQLVGPNAFNERTKTDVLFLNKAAFQNPAGGVQPKKKASNGKGQSKAAGGGGKVQKAAPPSLPTKETIQRLLDGCYEEYTPIHYLKDLPMFIEKFSKLIYNAPEEVTSLVPGRSHMFDLIKAFKLSIDAGKFTVYIYLEFNEREDPFFTVRLPFNNQLSALFVSANPELFVESMRCFELIAQTLMENDGAAIDGPAAAAAIQSETGNTGLDSEDPAAALIAEEDRLKMAQLEAGNEAKEAERKRKEILREVNEKSKKELANETKKKADELEAQRKRQSDADKKKARQFKADKIEQEKIERQREEAAKLEQERIRQREEADKLEQERIEHERVAEQTRQREEAARLEQEQIRLREEAAKLAEQTRLREEADRLEQERLKRDLFAEQTRLREVAAKLEQEKNRQREEAAKLEQEQIRLREEAAKLAEQTRLREEAAKLEQERIERERAAEQSRILQVDENTELVSFNKQTGKDIADLELRVARAEQAAREAQALVVQQRMLYERLLQSSAAESTRVAENEVPSIVQIRSGSSTVSSLDDGYGSNQKAAMAHPPPGFRSLPFAMELNDNIHTSSPQFQHGGMGNRPSEDTAAFLSGTYQATSPLISSPAGSGYYSGMEHHSPQKYPSGSRVYQQKVSPTPIGYPSAQYSIPSNGVYQKVSPINPIQSPQHSESFFSDSPSSHVPEVCLDGLLGKNLSDDLDLTGLVADLVTKTPPKQTFPVAVGSTGNRNVNPSSSFDIFSQTLPSNIPKLAARDFIPSSRTAAATASPVHGLRASPDYGWGQTDYAAPAQSDYAPSFRSEHAPGPSSPRNLQPRSIQPHGIPLNRQENGPYYHEQRGNFAQQQHQQQQQHHQHQQLNARFGEQQGANLYHQGPRGAHYNPNPQNPQNYRW